MLAAIAAPAHADTASDFLKSLEGSYSGRGNAVVIGEETTRITCKLTNTFSPSSNALQVSGDCASTKGKGKVNGTVTAKGNSVSGSFVSTRQNVKVTQTSGSIQNNRMVLSVSMMDEKVGRLIRVRQHVSRTASGIKADFYTYDNASQKYKAAGSINLKKR